MCLVIISCDKVKKLPSESVPTFGHTRCFFDQTVENKKSLPFRWTTMRPYLGKNVTDI